MFFSVISWSFINGGIVIIFCWNYSSKLPASCTLSALGWLKINCIFQILSTLSNWCIEFCFNFPALSCVLFSHSLCRPVCFACYRMPRTQRAVATGQGHQASSEPSCIPTGCHASLTLTTGGPQLTQPRPSPSHPLPTKAAIPLANQAMERWQPIRELIVPRTDSPNPCGSQHFGEFSSHGRDKVL